MQLTNSKICVSHTYKDCSELQYTTNIIVVQYHYGAMQPNSPSIRPLISVNVTETLPSIHSCETEMHLKPRSHFAA